MKKYKISAIADDKAEIIKRLTDEQYEFLKNIFEELEDTGTMYTPNFYIEEIILNN